MMFKADLGRLAVMTVTTENRDIWQDFNKRQEFEHDLINRKTTWWLTAQTLLFAAYGVTLTVTNRDASHFRRVVAVSGIALAVITLFGVAAVVGSKVMSWHDYKSSSRVTPRTPGHLDHWTEVGSGGVSEPGILGSRSRRMCFSR